MHIILLSGGSGTRLWPLSNDTRSKQFLKLLPVEGSDKKESMIQRVVRQIRQSGLDATLTVATSYNQKDTVISQLGSDIDIVVEPSRRNTFPAICLACEYLDKIKQVPSDEVVVVMPCDPYTDLEYFDCIKDMTESVSKNSIDLILMGITPTYPSTKYGYLIPDISDRGLSDKRGYPNTHAEQTLNLLPIKTFIEKPTVENAEKLIDEGAYWNGGVFAFKLKYILNIAEKFIRSNSFDEFFKNYSEFPKISFDYEVAEKANSIGMIPYMGEWKDLGTWNTLTDELPNAQYGNVTTDETIANTHIFNELEIPILCLGTKNLIVAASPDGIIISEKNKSENVKHYAEQLKSRPMYEERRWGNYRVLHTAEYPDGFSILTKELTLNPGCSISYQRHKYRDEIWTIVDGEGEIVIDGKRKSVKRGDTITIYKNQLHALRSSSLLTFIEIQMGKNLVEEDIERYNYNWDKN